MSDSVADSGQVQRTSSHHGFIGFGVPSNANSDEEEEGDYDEGEIRGDNQVSRAHDVKIQPLRSTVSTLGKGELTLATLGLEDEEDGFPNNSLGNSQQQLTSDSTRDAGGSGSGSGDSKRVELPMLVEPGATGGTVGGSRKDSSTSQRSSISMDVVNSNDSADTRPRSSSGVGSGGASTGYKGRKSVSSVRESVDGSMQNLSKPPKGKKKTLTGIAYASKKRNRDFHRIFRSVAQDDFLLDDFSCALSKEILVHGRLYVSERHVCFNSNILGWVTNLVISFDEIMTLEKKNTAGLFPNGIIIQTLHARHSFASFVSRDTVLDFLTEIWKQTTGHQPADMRNRITGHDSGSELSMSESDDEGDQNSLASKSDTDDMEESGDDGFDMSVDDESLTSLSDSEMGSSSHGKPGSEKHDSNSSVGGSKWPVPVEGPETHGPTTLPELNANEKVIYEDTLSAPLGVVANLLMGKDTTWLKHFLTDVEKNFELSRLPAFEAGEGGKKSRKYNYIKPLNSSVGPKQTKCNCTETLENWDLEDHVVSLTVTQTPDVPSGNSFTTRTRIGLCWTENNKTKMIISYWIDWTGKSWLKGPIEKGAHDGQVTFAKDLGAEINNSLVKAKGAGKAPARRKKAKKKPGKKPEVRPTQVEAPPSHGALSMLSNMLTQSVFNAPLYIWLGFFMLLLLTVMWGRNQRTEAIADQEQYKLLKLEEEFEMWKWLDTRSPEQRTFDPTRKFSEGDIVHFPLLTTKGSRPAKYEQFSLQDIREAIRITELRLSIVKDKLGVAS